MEKIDREAFINYALGINASKMDFQEVIFMGARVEAFVRLDNAKNLRYHFWYTLYCDNNDFDINNIYHFLDDTSMFAICQDKVFQLRRYSIGDSIRCIDESPIGYIYDFKFLFHPTLIDDRIVVLTKKEYTIYNRETSKTISLENKRNKNVIDFNALDFLKKNNFFKK